MVHRVHSLFAFLHWHALKAGFCPDFLLLRDFYGVRAFGHQWRVGACHRCYGYRLGMVTLKADKLCPLEHDEQVAVVRWADLQPYAGGRVGDYLWAVPNGGYRTRSNATHLKAEGVRRGVPDLQLGIARGQYHGLFIEMKRAKKSMSSVTREQREWHERLRGQGYAVAVCYGAQDAISVIKRYLSEDY